jgi:PIH1 N-terminal domain
MTAGGPAQSSASLDETLSKLKLSTDEAGRFEKAFKDKEFMKLFEDYAKEMQDPAARAETSAYLQQLERDGQLEQVYGKGTQLITPKPEFVVKTTDEQSGRKVFVNMCSSDKVRQFLAECSCCRAGLQCVRHACRRSAHHLYMLAAKVGA